MQRLLEWKAAALITVLRNADNMAFEKERK